MNIGTKINNLIKVRNITQEILAENMGVSQTKIHEIVSGKTQKIDFLFMNKICNFFEVDFEYFLEDKISNKNIKPKNCNIGCTNGVIHNSYPEGIIENMLKRIIKIEEVLNEKLK
jgi:transcriptional regulator with XRE-family HTH domain